MATPHLPECPYCDARGSTELVSQPAAGSGAVWTCSACARDFLTDATGRVLPCANLRRGTELKCNGR